MPLWQIMLMQGGMFLGLIVALRLLFARHLRAAMVRLQDLQEEALVKEAQLKEELHRAQTERAAEVEKGRQEAKLIMEAAARQAETGRATAEAQARQERQKLLDGGRAELAKLRVTLGAELEQRALQLALEILGDTLTREGKDALQHALMAEILDELAGVARDRFAVPVETAAVTSSVPLTAPERARLQQLLTDKVGRAVALTESVDPALVSGLVVRVGALVIDGSFRNTLRKSLARMRARPAPPVTPVASAPPGPHADPAS